MLKELIQYYKPYKVIFFADLLAAFLLACCDLVYPMLSRNIINDIVPNKRLDLLIIFVLLLLVIFMAKAGFNYFMQYQGHVIGVHMQADMRNKVFAHLQKLPNRYFDNNKTGVIMSRMINDLMDITELAHHGPEDLFVSGMMFIGSFVILCTINVPLTIIIFLFLPLVLAAAMAQRKKMGAAFMESRVKTGDVNAVVENSVAGVKVTKSFCTEAMEMGKFTKGNNLFVEARRISYKVMGQYYASMNFFIDILQLVALAAAGYFAVRGWINVGDFAAYVLYIKMFVQPVTKLVNFTEQYQNGITGFKRFLELLHEEAEKEPINPVPFDKIKGDIKINHVTFSYENNKNVLNDLTLHIPAGKRVALVGPSGGGKTTLCNLIPRFYDYDQGEILIDDTDIRSVSLQDLRRQIGVVQQEVFLFTGTIRDNILCGNPNASEEAVINAAKQAKIHDFIMDLPQGYDTFIGERGVKLSGGQKQRISIARVFLKNPPIIILDEATSALDNVTEHEIQSSLEDLGRDRTNLIIAHRLSTIKNADEILVLDNSGIAERGTHEELLALKGIYYKLHGEAQPQFIV